MERSKTYFSKLQTLSASSGPGKRLLALTAPPSAKTLLLDDVPNVEKLLSSSYDAHNAMVNIFVDFVVKFAESSVFLDEGDDEAVERGCEEDKSGTQRRTSCAVRRPAGKVIRRRCGELILIYWVRVFYLLEVPFFIVINLWARADEKVRTHWFRNSCRGSERWGMNHFDAGHVHHLIKNSRSELHV